MHLFLVSIHNFIPIDPITYRPSTGSEPDNLKKRNESIDEFDNYNLSTLMYLNTAEVLRIVKQRFRQGEIYTYTGMDI